MIKSADELPSDFGSVEGCCPDPRDKRIAELEAALDELHGAAYAMPRVASGGVTIVCVPIGAWENAMRAREP